MKLATVLHVARRLAWAVLVASFILGPMALARGDRGLANLADFLFLGSVVALVILRREEV